MDIPLIAAYSVLPKANVTDSRNEIKDDGNFIIWSESKGEGSRRVIGFVGAFAHGFAVAC